MRATVALWPLAAVFLAPAPTSAAPACLANGHSFAIGQTACLSISGKEHLARCEMVLNNTSWTKVGEDCSQGVATPDPDAKAQTKPAQPTDPKSAGPSEPNAN